MKRLFVSIVFAAGAFFAFGQGEFEAYRYGQTDLLGTARYMSMAGAFGALGGDATAIVSNPGGLGVYRNSDVSISFGATNTNVNRRGELNGALTNAALVFSFPVREESKLKNVNFSVSYNKIKDYNRVMRIQGKAQHISVTDYLADFTNYFDITEYDLKYVENEYDPYNNIHIPYMSIMACEADMMNFINGAWYPLRQDYEKVASSFSQQEKGSASEWTLALATNYNDIVFFGASLGVRYINYQKWSDLKEDFDYGGSMTFRNDLYTRGAGINLKIGAIVQPADFLRLGLSLHSPTFYYLEDRYYGSITPENVKFDNGKFAEAH